MNKSILITGVAGSGKSAVYKELRKRGYAAYGIEEIKGLFSMIDKKTGRKVRKHDNDNLALVKKREWICDKNKLCRLMRRNASSIAFYCGTASNLDELLPLFDRILLLRTNQTVLRNRLSTRFTNGFGRTAKVQKWIFSWKSWWEKHVREQGAMCINANQSLKKVVADIIKKSKSPV